MMGMKYVAVSTVTESGDIDVFCVDFYDAGDVVESIKDMMLIRARRCGIVFI